MFTDFMLSHYIFTIANCKKNIFPILLQAFRNIYLPVLLKNCVANLGKICPCI